MIGKIIIIVWCNFIRFTVLVFDYLMNVFDKQRKTTLADI